MAVIKPHCVNEKLAGQIIEDIKQRGFEIKAAEMFYLDRPAAEEFLDVYKGVIPIPIPVRFETAISGTMDIGCCDCSATLLGWR